MQKLAVEIRDLLVMIINQMPCWKTLGKILTSLRLFLENQ